MQNHSIRAALYSRVSSAVQEGGYSPETQEADCRRAAVERGYTVVRVFHDTHTGGDLWERPALDALREAVSAGGIDVVIAHTVDRLSRNQVHVAIIMDAIARAGGRAEFALETFEDSAVGRFILNARAFAAETELEKLRERTVRGRRGRAQSGKLLPGRTPLYGYAWNEDHSAYRVDELTAPLVRRIFSEALAGHSLNSIAVGLMRDGIPSPRGSDIWQRSTLHTILTSRAYVGEANYNTRRRVVRMENGRKIKTTARRPESEWIRLPDGTIPPLVDPATLEAIGIRLDRNKAQSARNNRHPEAALLRAGFGVCGYCGASLRVGIYRGIHQYRCSRYGIRPDLCRGSFMRCDELDRQVWARITEEIKRPERIERRLAQRRTNAHVADDLAAVKRRIAEVERRRNTLLDRLADVDDPDVAAAYQEKIAQFTAQRSALETERGHIEAAVQATERASARMRELREWCAIVAERVTGADYTMKRTALEWLDVRVKLYRSDEPQRWEIDAVPVDEDGVIVSVTRT